MLRPIHALRMLSALALLLALHPLHAIAEASPPTPEASPQRFSIKPGKTSATPVVFIPGLASPGAVWDEAAAWFEGAHVVNVAGFGTPPIPTDGPFMLPLVEALASYLDAHHLEDVVLVGHSLGGQVALRVAAARPERVSKVVVVDSAPSFARLLNPSITPQQAATFGANLRASLLKTSPEDFAAQSRQTLNTQSISPKGQARVSAWVASADQETVAWALGELMAQDHSDVLPLVKARVTILVAWSDVLPVSAADYLAFFKKEYAALPNAEVVLVKDSRHFIMVDRPELFERLLRGVVDPKSPAP